MPLQKGRQQFYGIKREATRLTAETTGFTFLPFISIAPKLESQYRDLTSAFARRAAIAGQDKTSEHATLNYEDILDADTAIYPFFYAFGVATPTTALGATTWAVSTSQNISLPTMTQVYSAGDAGQFSIRGSIVSKLSLNISKADASISYETVGIGEAATSGITPTITKTTKRLLGKHTTLAFASTLAGLSSATIIGNTMETTFEYDNGVDAARSDTLSQTNISNITADGVSATLTANINVDTAQAATIEAWQRSDTAQAFRLSIVGEDLPVIGTSTLKPTIRIDIPPSKVTIVKSINLDDYVVMELSITVSDADLIAPVIINQVNAV
jgi:hypothetical protein